MVGRPGLLDRLFVVFLFLLGLPPVAAYWLLVSHAAGAALLVLLVPQTVPLLWRRSRPIEVFAVVAAASALRLFLGRPEPDAVLAMAAAAYSVSVYGPERQRLVVAGLAVATVIVGAAGLLVSGGGDRTPWSALLPPVALALAAWVVGDYLRNRRRYLAELEARAARLQRDAEQARERAAEEERLRIARELHDVVAHQVSLMAIQAGAARVGGASDERAALASIETGARETLAELNRLLGVLRHDGAPADRSPRPGLADVETLLQGARDAGLQAHLEVTGGVRPLPAALELCAYRILQEGITNVLKHSGASRVDVRVHHGPTDLELTLFDDGAGSGDGRTPPGHGLVGMREQEDIAVVGDAADGEEAVAMASRLRPDVVLMDVRMPRLDGIEASRRITRSGLPSRVLILTTYELDEYVFDALGAGASGFLLKHAPPEELIQGARVVAAGDALLAPSVTRRLIEEFGKRPAPAARPPAALATLTERETEVLILVARGLTNAEIAARLHVGETTVKTHVGHVLDKLDLRDRVQAVVLAYETALVRPGG